MARTTRTPQRAAAARRGVRADLGEAVCRSANAAVPVFASWCVSSASVAPCEPVPSDFAALVHRLRERTAVDVLELAAHRQTPRDAAHAQALRAQKLAHVVRRGFTFDGEIGGEYRLANDTVGGTAQQPVEMDFARPHTIERRERAHENEVQPAVALGLLHHEEIARSFNDAQDRCIAACRAAQDAHGLFRIAVALL